MTQFYIYDERKPEAGRVFKNEKLLTAFAQELHDAGKDWGVFDAYEEDEVASAYDLAEALHGSWGRVRSIDDDRYMIRAVETGCEIESAKTLDAAEDLITEFEWIDMKNCCYEHDFYEIYDKLIEEIL